MAVGSHKQILLARVAETEKASKAATQEDERLRAELNGAQAQINSLQQRYETACRQVAERNPKAEDPSTLLAERDRHSHHVRGLQVLLSETEAAAQTANAAHVEASRALQAQLEIEEREQLEAAIEDARKKRDTAQTALADAEQVLNAAVWARSRFLRQQELKAQGRA